MGKNTSEGVVLRDAADVQGLTARLSQIMWMKNSFLKHEPILSSSPQSMGIHEYNSF